MRGRIALVALCLASAVPFAVARPEPALTPRQLIERAIVAHGGYEKLAKSHAERIRLRGTMFVGKSAVPFTNDLTLQLPGQYKSVVVVQQGERRHGIVHLLDGDNATVVIDGQPQTVNSLHLSQLRQTLQLEQAMRLVPLLSDPGFSLMPGQDYAYNGGVITSVRVQGKGQRELVLYFDRASALLVKSEHKIDGPGGKDILQEAFYSDFREVGGHVRPGKVLVQRDGQKVMEAELVAAQRVVRIDVLEFRRP